MVQVVLPNDANPLGFILGGTVMHLIDIAGAIAVPPAHAQPAGHRRRRRPAVPAPDQGRRPDRPPGARDRGVEHVARGRGGGLLGGDADRRAADDEPRLPDVRRDRPRRAARGGAAAQCGDRRGADEGGGGGAAAGRAAAAAPAGCRRVPAEMGSSERRGHRVLTAPGAPARRPTSGRTTCSS